MQLSQFVKRRNGGIGQRFLQVILKLYTQALWISALEHVAHIVIIKDKWLYKLSPFLY